MVLSYLNARGEIVDFDGAYKDRAPCYEDTGKDANQYIPENLRLPGCLFFFRLLFEKELRIQKRLILIFWSYQVILLSSHLYLIQASQKIVNLMLQSEDILFYGLSQRNLHY